jgi:hypothetical protein
MLDLRCSVDIARVVGIAIVRDGACRGDGKSRRNTAGNDEMTFHWLAPVMKNGAACRSRSGDWNGQKQCDKRVLPTTWQDTGAPKTARDTVVSTVHESPL